MSGGPLWATRMGRRCISRQMCLLTLPPEESIIYICGFPPLSDTKAISLPVGDHDGETSSPQLSVSRVRPLPSLFTPYMSAFPFLLITTASRCPSGAQEAPIEVPSGSESLLSIPFLISFIYTADLPSLNETYDITDPSGDQHGEMFIEPFCVTASTPSPS